MQLFGKIKKEVVKVTALSLSVLSLGSVLDLSPIKSVYAVDGGSYYATDLAVDITKNADYRKQIDSNKVSVGKFKLYVNGRKVELKEPILVLNGSSFLPLREVGDARGANVYWDAKNKIAKLEINNKDTDISTYLELPINFNTISVEGLFTVPVALDNDTVSFIDVDKGLTYVPLRTISENLAGVSIIYYSDTNVISITTDGSSPEDPTI